MAGGLKVLLGAWATHATTGDPAIPALSVRFVRFLRRLRSQSVGTECQGSGGRKKGFMPFCCSLITCRLFFCSEMSEASMPLTCRTEGLDLASCLKTEPDAKGCRTGEAAPVTEWARGGCGLADEGTDYLGAYRWATGAGLPLGAKRPECPAVAGLGPGCWLGLAWSMGHSFRTQHHNAYALSEPTPRSPSTENRGDQGLY